MADVPTGSTWRDSGRAARLGPFDAIAAFPLLVFIFHIKIWTLVFSIATMMFLTALGQYGFTIPVFLRWCRATLAGSRRLATPWWL